MKNLNDSSIQTMNTPKESQLFFKDLLKKSLTKKEVSPQDVKKIKAKITAYED